jgi:hypothetical protein
MRFAIVLLIVLAACKEKERAPESTGAPRADKPTPASPSCDSTQQRVCVGDKVVACLGGALGKTLEECKAGCRAGTCTNTCAVKGVELVYVVDSGHNLLSFDPQRLPGDPFHMIGKLKCETAGQPFSMAVANDGIAWVLYNTGRIYRVSILDAHCAKAGDPDAGPDTFGMGFAADGPTTEKLYLAGNDSAQQLAVLDTKASLQWVPIATIAADQKRNPELTGTADGALFGYFPDEVSGGFVQQLDAATGKVIGAQMKLAGGGGDVEAYAFAHWGGVFYVFTTIDHTNMVHAIHRKTGKYELVLPRIPYEIVGAGVSTCAPELEREAPQ